MQESAIVGEKCILEEKTSVTHLILTEMAPGTDKPQEKTGYEGRYTSLKRTSSSSSSSSPVQSSFTTLQRSLASLFYV